MNINEIEICIKYDHGVEFVGMQGYTHKQQHAL